MVAPKHFRRFVVGQPAVNLERIFDQLYHASLHYGRKGLTLNAISVVACAIWDLLGKLRGEPAPPPRPRGWGTGPARERRARGRDAGEGRELVGERSHPIMISGGEHEYTRWGFENLLSSGVDMIQPDIHWCGGLTELLKIKALASARSRLCVLHASSVYSYHFAITSDATPFSEFLMMAPEADRVVPMFEPLFTDEPVPVDGHVTPSDEPGFGVTLNPELHWERPFQP